MLQHTMLTNIQVFCLDIERRALNMNIYIYMSETKKEGALLPLVAKQMVSSGHASTILLSNRIGKWFNKCCLIVHCWRTRWPECNRSRTTSSLGVMHAKARTCTYTKMMWMMKYNVVEILHNKQQGSDCWKVFHGCQGLQRYQGQTDVSNSEQFFQDAVSFCTARSTSWIASGSLLFLPSQLCIG